ncbi:hypothetical protein NFI96_002163 [Prochilodus magdalenae]|nr:hypothetical protein NFI96_002163 [Prochilodus magdalenae]
MTAPEHRWRRSWFWVVGYTPSELEDGSADIFLDGIVSRNRALNGDVVVVKLLPPEHWKASTVIQGKGTSRPSPSPWFGFFPASRVVLFMMSSAILHLSLS